MRTLIALIFVLSTGLAQQMPSGKPETLARLQKDEVVRIYRRGGLTRGGPYWSLTSIKQNGKIFIKGVDGAFSSRLTSEQTVGLLKSIGNTDWSKITAVKRTGLPPSAADGQDIYLSYRAGARQRLWSNADYEYTAPIPLLEAIDELERSVKGGH